MKLARLPSCERKSLAPNWFFTITPNGFCKPVTNAIIKNKANIIAIGSA